MFCNSHMNVAGTFNSIRTLPPNVHSTASNCARRVYKKKNNLLVAICHLFTCRLFISFSLCSVLFCSVCDIGIHLNSFECNITSNVALIGTIIVRYRGSPLAGTLPIIMARCLSAPVRPPVRKQHTHTHTNTFNILSLSRFHRS